MEYLAVVVSLENDSVKWVAEKSKLLGKILGVWEEGDQ